MTNLEHRYRRWLRLYPRSYRTYREEEIVGMLLESSHPGQDRPSLREAGAIIWHAGMIRVGIMGEGRLGGSLQRLSTPFVALAGLFSLWALVFGELLSNPMYIGTPTSHVYTTGWVCYSTWLVVTILFCTNGFRWRGPAIVMALCATLLTAPVSDLLHLPRPPLFFLVTISLLGTMGLFAHLTPQSPPARAFVVIPFTFFVVMVSATGIATASSLSISWRAELTQGAFYQSWLDTVAAWAPPVAIAALLIAVTLMWARHQQVAIALAGSTVPWIVISALHAPRPTTKIVSEVILTFIIFVTIAWDVSGRHNSERGRESMSTPETSS